MKNSLIKIFLIIFAFVFLAQISFAIENEKVLTLKDCIEKALSNSPLIKGEKLRYKMSKDDVKVAQSAYFPTFSIGTGYDFKDSETNNRSSNSNKFNINASLRQLIWDFGKTHSHIKMQKYYNAVALYDFDTAVLDTIYDVKVKYYSYLAARAGVEIDKANVLINERNYQRTKAYFEEGLKSKIDLVNAEVYLTEAKTGLIASENLYKNSLIALNNAMYLAYNPKYDIEVPSNFKQIGDFTPKSLTDFSKPLDDFLAPPDDLSDATLSAKVETVDMVSLYKLEKFPHTFEKCLELAKENRPDIKAYDSTYKAMEQYLIQMKRDNHPVLSLSGSYGYDATNANHRTTDTNNFGVGLNLSTTFNMMSEKYETDIAELQVELAKNDIELLNQTVYFDVQTAYVNMMEFEEQIPLLGQKVAQTLENLQLADGRYSVGLGDYIELQDAKVNYNNAQHSFVKAVFNYNVAKARLEQAMGQKQDITITLEDK